MFLRKLRVHKDGKEHGYWSLVETLRTADGRRQRTLCYLGELNGSAHARWQKTVEVFNEQGETTQLKLFQASAEAERVSVFAGRSAKTTGEHSQRGHCAANGGRARDLATTHRQTRPAAAKHSSPAQNYTARASGAATNSKM
jgi:hypothetical protein